MILLQTKCGKSPTAHQTNKTNDNRDISNISTNKYGEFYLFTSSCIVKQDSSNAIVYLLKVYLNNTMECVNRQLNSYRLEITFLEGIIWHCVC